MARCEIAPEALADVAALFRSLGVAVTGSNSGKGVVVLELVGECIPAAPTVRCTLERTVVGNTAVLTARFEVDNGTPT